MINSEEIYLVEDCASTHEAIFLFVARLGGEIARNGGDKTKKFITELKVLQILSYELDWSDSPKPEPGREAYTLGSLPFLQQS